MTTSPGRGVTSNELLRGATADPDADPDADLRAGPMVSRTVRRRDVASDDTSSRISLTHMPRRSV
jgi:hypothetical protein